MMQELEIQLNNITPARFLAYVRRQAKIKNIPVDVMGAKEFAALPEESLGSRIHGHDNYRFDFYYQKPYEYQTCTIDLDGYGFNEICEFEFYDDKVGAGYFYFMENDKLN